MDKASSLDSRAVAKWREAGKAGFQLVPDLLLKKQAELGLTAIDALVLLNITMHWWYPEQRPFPRTTTIAKRMGLDVRTIQRSMKNLASLGLVRKVNEDTASVRGRQVCDLTGLVLKLAEFALDDPDYAVRTKERGVVAHGT